MGDWMISKKRFWGLALPIWVDEQTGDFEVIGGCDELKERAVEGWDEFAGHTPHRPWIDQVKIRNPKTRQPDGAHPRRRQSLARRRHRALLDDGLQHRSRRTGRSGSRPTSSPRAFPGQFRNWFYAILAMSTMMEQPAAVQGAARPRQVRDQNGEEMHKSKGNAFPLKERPTAVTRSPSARSSPRKLPRPLSRARPRRPTPSVWTSVRLSRKARKRRLSWPSIRP